MKNIFLGIIFLCIFMLPNIVKAENLYSGDRSISELQPYQLSILEERLKASESKFEVNKAKWNTKNVYRINTGKNNIFIYDPTPEDTSNKDAVVLGTMIQEKDGIKDYMYVPKDPGMYKESKEANNFFDRIDIDQGSEPGTTVRLKNERYNADKVKQEKQNEYDRLAAIAKQEEQEAAALQNDPNATPEQISKAINDAKLARDAANEAGRAVVQAGGALAQIDNNIAQSQTWTDTSNQCSGVLGPFGSFYCVSMLIAKVTNIIFKLTSFVAYLVGTLFDYSLELSVNSAEFFKRLGVVEVTWTFIRDILNITFIFILLWAAIQILIGNEAQYNAKKVLMNVVIVAILINFSLFAAKLMVDGSNIVSLKLYETMKASSKESPNTTISARVMNTVGMTALYDITKIFNDTTIQTGNSCANNPGALITISVMGSIFLIILSLALGLAAVLFLVRLVNIIYLFIKSPLWVWGYVLPGNPSIAKFKNDWQAEMKHVLVFPIAYLFWMLVAIIIFEKLGGVKGVGATGKPASFLDLICNNPGAGDISNTISILAVFVIVIIFMMRAISYGIKHAAGAPGTVGGSWSKKIAEGAGKWQDKVTTGLAKKTWDGTKYAGAAAAGAGIGTAKGGLTLMGRTGVGLMKGKYGDKGFKEGFKEGFLNPSINTKEWLRDQARTIAASNSNNMLGDAAAKFAKKYDDPKNRAGETRKQAEGRRVKTAEEKEKDMYDAIDKKYKIESQKDWMKKKENEGKSAEDYKSYLEETIKNRTDALLGSEIGERDSGKQDEHGNNTTHLTELRKASIKEEKDDAGNITGYKFNETAMHNTLQNMMKYHSEGGAGQEGLDIKNGKKRKFEVLKNKKAAARIKVITEALKKSESGALTKDAKKARDEYEIQNLKETIEYLEKLPDEKAIDAFVNNPSGPTKYIGHGDNEKTIKELNKRIQDLSTAKSTPGVTADVITTLEKNVQDAKASYLKHLNKQKGELAKKKNSLANRITKEAKEAEEKDKDKK